MQFTLYPVSVLLEGVNVYKAKTTGKWEEMIGSQLEARARVENNNNNKSSQLVKVFLNRSCCKWLFGCLFCSMVT